MSWTLKNMGVNGKWWLRRINDQVYLSVADIPGAGRSHTEFWWRIKVGSNILFDGNAPTVLAAQKAAEDSLREWTRSLEFQ